MTGPRTVIPEKAGIQWAFVAGGAGGRLLWIPAFAEMTRLGQYAA